MKKSFPELVENASSSAVGSANVASGPASFRGGWPDPEKPKFVKFKRLERKDGGEVEDTD